MVCKPVAKLALVAAAATAQFAAVVAGSEDGQATWHIFGSEVACPGSFGTTKVFALDARLFAMSASKCGMCSVVTGRKGSVVARFVDRCVGSACKDMDLSKDAFHLIADVDEGITDIKFSDLRPCEQLHQLSERAAVGDVTIASLDGEIGDLVLGGEADAEPAAGGEDGAQGDGAAAAGSPRAAAPAPAPAPAADSSAAPAADARNGTAPAPPAGRRPADAAPGSASPAAAAAALAPLAAVLPFALAAGTLI